MRKIAIAAVLFSLAVPSLAFAEAPRSGEATTYDFMDDLVTGGRYSPDGDLLTVRPGAARQTLIRARAHFIPELVKSVEIL